MNTVLLFIVVLGPLIFFHELGHFLVARLFGVGVEKFSLGFGPRIYGKKVGRTDYRLSLIPLGGFVKMVGDEPDADLPPEDIPFSFTHKHVFKRSLIVFAGPLFNVLLALFIFMSVLYFHGIESIKPVVRDIAADGPAEQAGLQLGDRIAAVNEQPVASWRDINAILTETEGEKISLQVVRRGEITTISFVPQEGVRTNFYGDNIPYFDFGISGMAKPPAIVGQVTIGMPAHKKGQGLKEGDVIVSIDGRPITFWHEMQEIVSGSDGKRDLLFVIKRQNETKSFKIKPIQVEDRNLLGNKQKFFRIGIGLRNLVPDEDLLNIEFGFIESFTQSCRALVLLTESIFEFIQNAFRGKVSRELVGGPIKIAVIAKQTAKMGLVELLNFVAAISLQLAILNLLPIPVLDGGHLLFFSIEAIKRGPLSTRARETAQQIGLFFLLLLMIFVIYNDIVFTWFK